MDCSSILTYSDLYSDCYHSYISLHDLFDSVPLPLLLLHATCIYYTTIDDNHDDICSTVD
jgi:hypothetical protein